MPTRLIAALSLAAALTAAPACAQSAGGVERGAAQQKLFRDLDPDYAAAFLKDAAAQAALKLSDPDAEARLVERAARLKDMRDLLDAHAETASLNEALRARLADDQDSSPAGLGFGREPGRLLAWRARYGGFAAASRDAVAAALWEWSALSDEQRRWLSGPPERLTEAAWAKTAFPDRQQKLARWATSLYDAMMASSPKTKAELDALKAVRYKIWEAMDGDQKRRSGEFMGQAEAAVEGLEKLKTLPRTVLESADPRVRALLAQARSGASPESVLDALSQLFDQAAVHDDAVQLHAPGLPAQKLSSVDPKLLGDMLASGLRDEIRGVPAGNRVDAFFTIHPFVVRVRNLGTELAHFETGSGEMVFNERFLNDWIRGQGLTAQDVIKSPARFRELVMILAPVFVHESTHQIQKDWADAHGLPWWNGQHQEIEADEAEFDYVLAKEAASPAYREFLKREVGRSYYVAQTVTQAETLRRDPRNFPHKVMSDYYAGLPSLEQTAADKLADADRALAGLRAQRSLSRKPASVDPLIAAKLAERERTLGAYRLLREREESSLALLDREIDDSLRAGKGAAPASGVRR